MRRQVPLIITFVCGVFMFFQYFIPHRISVNIFTEANAWTNIIFNSTYILGILSLIRHHLKKIDRKSEGWGYSMVTLISLFVMASVGFLAEFEKLFVRILPSSLYSWLKAKGFFAGMEADSLFQTFFNSILLPLEATMFSILAFYISSAAFRAFRARNIDATLLLLAAGIIMIGRVPIGYAISKYLPDAAAFILEYPNTGAKRAILIGIGLGMISMALKIIIGIERSYLGREE